MPEIDVICYRSLLRSYLSIYVQWTLAMNSKAVFFFNTKRYKYLID